METILITGGTGLIGTHLSQKLITLGFNVIFLSRNEDSESKIIRYIWNYESNYIDIEAIKKADYIIHLAGAGVGDKRWTTSRKKIVLESRTKTSTLLLEAIRKHKPYLKCFISASAIGYYGAVSVNDIFTEKDQPDTDFLGKVCSEWEQLNSKYAELNIRSSIIRIGVVLSPKGGPLQKIVAPIKAGFGSYLGSGRQYMPWIHIDDLCSVFIQAIQKESFTGIYNAVSPNHLTNGELTDVIANEIGKTIWAPNIPRFVLKLIFGEMSKVFLEGSRVSSEKLVNSGFVYKYPLIKDAIANLLQKT